MTRIPVHGISVFTRNYPEVLAYATKVAESDSERLVTFRSKKSWSTAKSALEKQGPGRVAVFFAVVGQPLIQFKALLQEVHLGPVPENPKTERLLRFVPGAEANDPLEGERTLYAVSGCYRLDDPFPLSDLRKAEDNNPLSEGYNYSYSIVLQPEPVDALLEYPAPDTPQPPARIEASISRIIRDTAMVRRLKSLYNNTCQICGTRLALTSGRGYSEGHHLRPLGSPHDGPDVSDNIIIVCPNCHALLDRCSLPLDTSHLRCHPDHRIGLGYVDYHNALRSIGVVGMAAYDSDRKAGHGARL